MGLFNINRGPESEFSRRLNSFDSKSRPCLLSRQLSGRPIDATVNSFGSTAFLNTPYVRVFLPLLILYTGLKHFWRLYSIPKCLQKQFLALKRQGKVWCHGCVHHDTPIHFTPPLPPMTRVAFSDPNIKVPVTLVDKSYVTDDTRKFVFALPWPCISFGIPIGYYLVMYAMIDGEQVSRCYTPHNIRSDGKPYIEFGIQILEDGRMSQFLDRLVVGGKVELSGPVGSFSYRGNSLFSVHYPKNPEVFCKKTSTIFIIVSGRSVYRILGLLKALCEEGKNAPCVKMLYGNKNEENIKEKSYLEVLHCESQFFTVVHVIENKSLDLPAVQGVICKELIEQEMPPVGQNPLIFIYGNPIMVKQSTFDVLQLGHPYSRVINY